MNEPPKTIMARSVEEGDKIQEKGEWRQITRTIRCRNIVILFWKENGKEKEIHLYPYDQVRIQLKNFDYGESS